MPSSENKFPPGILGPILSIQSVTLQDQSEYNRIKLSKNKGMSTTKEFGTSTRWSVNTETNTPRGAHAHTWVPVISLFQGTADVSGDGSVSPPGLAQASPPTLSPPPSAQ